MQIAKRNDPVAGVLWMVLSCSLIAGIAALGRYLTMVGVPPAQVVFLRVLFALITMLPLFVWHGSDLLRTDQIKTYGVRVVIGVLSMSAWFAGLATIPVGQVTAISFIAPLCATVFAVFLLGEVVRIRRWLATLIGFGGALIILRPGFQETSPGVWLIVFSAVGMGMSTIYIKRLTNLDGPDKVVFISTLLMTPLTLVPALLVWEWPTADIWPYLLALGPVATLGHVTLARAFAATEASIVMGVDFLRLPFAVFYGFLAFGEIIDMWTWIGAGIIFTASIYIARREMKLNSIANQKL